jgi:hypothetical protein
VKREIIIDDYDPDIGFSREWDFRSKIECFIENDQIIIRANEEGLESLAISLLTLAQKGVPDSYHLHFDVDDLAKSLEKGSLVTIKKL